MELVSLTVKHERRVRLYFDEQLAIAAFSMLSSYVFTSTDSFGLAPVVQSLYIVPSANNVIEVVFSDDLIEGGNYQVTAIGIPAVSANVSTNLSTLQFRVGANQQLIDREPATTNNELALYGRDITWNGIDYVETATGDLARVSGLMNVDNALHNRMFEEVGLPWDKEYGLKARRYVDGPTGSTRTLQSDIQSELLKDDRVTAVTCEINDDDDTDVTFNTTATLLGDRQATQIDYTVDNG